MRMSHELGRPFRASGFSTRQSQGVALGCDRPHLWCFEPALRCRLIIGVAEAVIDGLWCFGPALRCRLIIGVAKTEIDGLGYFDPSRHRRLIVGRGNGVRVQILDKQSALIGHQPHRVKTFQEEFRTFLAKHKIQFDERYVWD